MWFFYMYVASTKQSYFWFLELAPGISHNMCGVRVWCACVVCVCGVRVCSYMTFNYYSSIESSNLIGQSVYRVYVSNKYRPVSVYIKYYHLATLGLVPIFNALGRGDRGIILWLSKAK